MKNNKRKETSRAAAFQITSANNERAPVSIEPCKKARRAAKAETPSKGTFRVERDIVI